MKTTVTLFTFSVGLFLTNAQAAVSSQSRRMESPPSSILRTAGAIRGGQAGLGFSLLGVQSRVAKSQKLERLTVLIGNGALQPQEGSPGYFQIESNPQQKRIVINFPQTINSAFKEKTLQSQFAKSPFVKSSQMIFEPQGQTTSFVLNLKKPASLRVIPVSGNKTRTAQLFIDLFDDNLIPKNSKTIHVLPQKKVQRK